MLSVPVLHRKFNDYFTLNAADFNKDKLINCFFGIFSAKQTVRTDSILTSCCEMIPHFKRAFMQEIWKIIFTVNRILDLQNDQSLSHDMLAIESLHRLESAISDQKENEISLNKEEGEAIEQFLSRSMSENLSFKMNAYLIFSGKENLWRTLKASRELFKPLQENCVESLRNKLNNIRKCWKESIEPSFGQDDQLNSKDVRLLHIASDRKRLLSLLNTLGISLPRSKDLSDKWDELQKLSKSDTVDHLRNLCMVGYQPGRVFFYDWSFNQIRDFFPFRLKSVIEYILYGRIPHVAVIVKNSENETCLSHVNGATNGHALHPVKSPILGALGSFVELDISPLLPSNVSLEHKSVLQNHFTKIFIRLASETYPNITIKWKLVSTFFLGHKSLFSNDISNISLHPQQTQLCSSFVGVIFLQAIHEVNQQLSILGYKDKIQHPFGSHEMLDRVDIPRLIYHWKQLKIMKVVPVDTFVSKVFFRPKAINI